MAKPRRKKDPTPLTPEAVEARKRFDRKYESFLREAQKESLSILVWGQNPKRRTPPADKREEIRSKLRELGHNAMFSEEIPPPNGTTAAGQLSEKSKEFAQARAADLVIVLVEDAPGALAETHDFCNHPEIGPKTLIMIPEAYQNGYSAQGAIADAGNAFGNVYWYKPEDVTECNLLGEAVKKAEALRNIHYQWKCIRT